MSLWIFGFYGSVFGGYVLYYYASKNYMHFLYMMGKIEAYGQIFYRSISSYFKTDTKNLAYNIPNNVDIKFNKVEDQLTQCRVNNLSEDSDTCKYKFMLIEVVVEEIPEKISVSLENKNDNFTAYVSNNKLDKHFWKWYLETFYNDQVNSLFTKQDDIKYKITIMDNKYKPVTITQDDYLWLKKFGYEVVKPVYSNKILTPVNKPLKKRTHMKRNNFNGTDYSTDDEDSILSCINLASSDQISANPNKYYKMK